MSLGDRRDCANGNDDSAPAGQTDEALRHIEAALRLLDETDAPSDVGAHLDLAMHRLRSWLSSGRS